jgi:hypothetical protein
MPIPLAFPLSVQLCVLGYFPTFRRQWEIRRPYLNEMLTVKKTLEQTGLKAVVVQKVVGHIGLD